MKTRIAIVILAAGESSRMGQPKQLLPWGEDILINHIVKETLKVPYSGRFVVLGANADLIKEQIHPGVQIIENSNWDLGMGTSIALAVKTLKSRYDAIQFVLVDQPQLNSIYLKFQLHTYQYKYFQVVATQYEDTIGIPALFDQRYFSKLEELTTDGAKSFLNSLTSKVKAIKPKVYLEDMDTLAQYKLLHKNLIGEEPKS